MIGAHGEYEVCVNPLCRRRWKLLSSSSIPIFCPTCKKWLDAILCGSPETITDYWQNLLTVWFCVYSEIASRLHLHQPLSIDARRITDAQSLLKEYTRCFPRCPRHDTVRNWSSMGQRKRPVLGKLVSKGKYLCEVRPSTEFNLNSTLFFIDWTDSYKLNSTLSFIPFPNPSSDERMIIPNLVKAVELVSEPPASTIHPPKMININPGASVKVVSNGGGQLTEHMGSSRRDENAADSFADFDDILCWAGGHNSGVAISRFGDFGVSTRAPVTSFVTPTSPIQQLMAPRMGAPLPPCYIEDSLFPFKMEVTGNACNYTHSSPHFERPAWIPDTPASPFFHAAPSILRPPPVVLNSLLKESSRKGTTSSTTN